MYSELYLAWLMKWIETILRPRILYLVSLAALYLTQMACIGDDLIFDEVAPMVRISNAIDTIEIGTEYVFAYSYFNNTGVEEAVPGATWFSDNPSIIRINEQGVATALEMGTANISVHLTDHNGIDLMDTHMTTVGISTVTSNAVRTGKLRTTSSYKLTGSFSLQQKDGDLLLSLADDYEASSNLPGLVVYLTNNPNTINNAFEIDDVEVFKGAHSYLIKGVNLNDYSHVLYFCKPFVVKVGDGAFDN